MLKKIYNTLGDNFYFCLFYLITNLIVVTVLKDIPYINILSKIGLVWGIIIVLINTIKIYKRKPTLIELTIFVFLAFTLCLNLIAYRNGENLKVWAVNSVILLAIFCINTNKDTGKLKKELKVISNAMIIFTFIMSLISTIMYYGNITFTLNEVIYGDNQGLYIYKNSLAIASSISILISVYLITEYKKSKYKIFYLLNIFLQLFPLFYSNGRSAVYLYIAVPFVLIFMRYKNKYFRGAMIVIPAMLGIGGFAVFHEKLYTVLSARNELWYSAWLSVKNNLFSGVGNSELVETVYSMRPGVVLPGIEDGGLHNIYLQIVTANGIIALILFLIVLYAIFVFLVKSVDKSYGNNKKVGLVLLSMLVGILFVNLFESNLIYIVSFISIIFWIYTGYFVSIKYSEKR
ncbi:MAG: O-antigen ligase family protein [Clostridiaceae bacterium]|nr:O-antigen ligase family protein [Clostridiaceae bacterium]